MQAVDTLIQRLAESPIDSSTSWKPSMDKVSNSLWGKFSSFVAGEEVETPPTTSGPGSDSGHFQRLAGETPPMSTNASTTDLYSAYQSGATTASAAPNSRYAPNNAYAPRRASDQVPKSRYDPAVHSSNNASHFGNPWTRPVALTNHMHQLRTMAYRHRQNAWQVFTDTHPRTGSIKDLLMVLPRSLLQTRQDSGLTVHLPLTSLLHRQVKDIHNLVDR